MMKRWTACLLALALAAAADAAFAGGSRGGHGSRSSAAHVAGTGTHFRSGFAHGPFFHHRRVIVGSTIFIGAVGYPYYYSPAPVYAAPPAYADEPVTYIEQSPAAGGQVLYYCPDSRAYYPNVTTCPSPWLKVVP